MVDNKLPSLTTFELKILAIIAMTVDHATLLFLSNDYYMAEYLRMFGKLTLPIMCFLLVEGYGYTKNKYNYAKRLLIFALISQTPFLLMVFGMKELEIDPSKIFFGNILFNLLLALLILIVWDTTLSRKYKIIFTIFCLFISNYLDWGLVPIILVLTLQYFKNDKKQQLVAYYLVAMSLIILNDMKIISIMPSLCENWMLFGILLAPLTWVNFNGMKGSNFGGRYFFYWFYPMHIFLLVIIKNFFYNY